MCTAGDMGALGAAAAIRAGPLLPLPSHVQGAVDYSTADMTCNTTLQRLMCRRPLSSLDSPSQAGPTMSCRCTKPHAPSAAACLLQQPRRPQAGTQTAHNQVWAQRQVLQGGPSEWGGGRLPCRPLSCNPVCGVVGGGGRRGEREGEQAQLCRHGSEVEMGGAATQAASCMQVQAAHTAPV